MEAAEVLKIIRQAVQDVKNNKQDVVSSDALLKYLDALARDVEVTNEPTKRHIEADLAVFRAEHERNIAQYQAQETRAVELFRSVITYGSAAMKSSLLINGGAAVAILAFIGNIWTKETGLEAVKSLTTAILLFSFGVLAAALGTAGSYFSQYCYAEPFPRAGIVFHTLTVMFVLGSFALFGFGSYEAYAAFAKHLRP